MLITFIRAIIMYILITLAVRVMGKRQVGELKPSELVITILVSQIATIPIEDNGLPLLNSIVPLLAMISFEIITSVFSMKSLGFRNLMQGRPIFIIRDGKIDQKQMKRVRFTMDDLVDALRQKDIFCIEDVEYAIVETNGSLSVLPKPAKQTVTAEMLKLSSPAGGMPMVVIIDGKRVSEYFSGLKMDLNGLDGALEKAGVKEEEVLLATRDRQNQYMFIKKEEYQ